MLIVDSVIRLNDNLINWRLKMKRLIGFLFALIIITPAIASDSAITYVERYDSGAVWVVMDEDVLLCAWSPDKKVPLCKKAVIEADD